MLLKFLLNIAKFYQKYIRLLIRKYLKDFLCVVYVVICATPHFFRLLSKNSSTSTIEYFIIFSVIPICGICGICGIIKI